MTPVIEVDNLTKTYKHSKSPSVDHISFNVEPGEFFAFLGPNGAGKTTTMSILTTTLDYDAGAIRIAGYDVAREARRVREHIGIIFQRPSLDQQLTAEQNIRIHACMYGVYAYRPTFKLMPKSYRDRVLELAEVVGVGDALFKPVRRLSGGMQRKLEIVRSLIHTPEVLFLDEPTTGMDAESRRGLWDYIDEVRKQYGTTIFLTTHYIDEAEGVDTVCIINHGKIVTCSSPDAMKQSLLRQEIILDATDRGALCRELDGLGLTYKLNGHVTLAYQGSAQELLAKIQTKLTTLQVTDPSLEDAYVTFLNTTSGTEAPILNTQAKLEVA
ncbi:MAG: ATP-binding cassette domain-containing protein [Coriobacteriia bacterium]|nr:ATP-binding cassette domain-containing protein [Coriobacteriia bacterium]